MSFIGVLETVGKEFVKGLKWALEYAIPVEKLVALLFPSAAPATTALIDATTLIQNAVIAVEQKYAAANMQNATGAQKLAEVMLLAEPVVSALLTQAGIAASTDYIQSLVSAVVALLNVQSMPSSTAATA